MSKSSVEPILNSTIEGNPVSPVGKQLSAALAQHEIHDLLDVLFATVPPPIQEQALAQLNPDTSQTIRQILWPSSSPATLPSSLAELDRPISLAKLKQTWSKLWQEWDGIVFAAAEEDGRYTVQEVDWEPPYFDGAAFAEDLDQVAGRMLPMVQTAFDKGFFPDTSFAQALLEAEAGVSKGLSEGMQRVERIRLGSKLTTCVLQWEWLLTLEEEKDAYSFAQRVRQWQERFTWLELANNAIAHFFTQFSQSDGRCIFRGLQRDKEIPLWQRVLSNPHSTWSIFYAQLIQQYPELPESP